MPTISSISKFVITVVTVAASGLLAVAQTSEAGKVKVTVRAESSFDAFTNSPSSSLQSWFRSKLFRMEVSSPYFDSRTGWYPDAWAYIDLYSLYRGSSLANQHPGWILKDMSGHDMYIPYGCSNGSCPQYAGDPGNADFRNWWISNAKKVLSHGYKGLWIDDANLVFRVGDGNGNFVSPKDPRTGQAMTQDAWEGYVVGFLKQIRSAIPNAEIVHNSIWFAGGSARDQNPNVVAEIKAADYINCERGISDGGLTGGTGVWSVNAFLGFIDHVHDLGKSIIMNEYSLNGEYGLAGYFLVSQGNDLLSGGETTPDQWWGGYNVALGTPQGKRYTWNQLLRRDFSSGIVLLNLPGAPKITVNLPGSMKRINGSWVSSITLSAGQGAVLSRSTLDTQSVQAVRIDSGGGQVSSFAPDTYVSGGHSDKISSPINLSGVANAAPADVYLSKRTTGGDTFTYNIPNLESGHQYTVRLHFADDQSSATGTRMFNVSINGSTVLSNFDVYAAAGKKYFKAVVKDFSATPNGGTITIKFSPGSAGNALINGIEILP
jgi:hypothetical protein